MLRRFGSPEIPCEIVLHVGQSLHSLLQRDAELTLGERA
jgi:hypothetical protein